MTDDNDRAPKQVWVTPEIRSLDVAETRQNDGRGTDGGRYGIDCTRS